jgi:hypothetical protein
MNRKLPMPSKKELAAMTDEDLDKKVQAARAIMQEAKQLARDATEQTHVFTAYEKEQKHRTKSALQVEAEVENDEN